MILVIYAPLTEYEKHIFRYNTIHGVPDDTMLTIMEELL